MGNSASLAARAVMADYFWRLYSGSPAPAGPWRDPPPFFGKWNTVFKHFRDWLKADVFKRIFDRLPEEPGMEFAMIDAMIVRVHRYGQGAKGGFKTRPLANQEVV